MKPTTMLSLTPYGLFLNHFASQKTAKEEEKNNPFWNSDFEEGEKEKDYAITQRKPIDSSMG